MDCKTECNVLRLEVSMLKKRIEELGINENLLKNYNDQIMKKKESIQLLEEEEVLLINETTKLNLEINFLIKERDKQKRLNDKIKKSNYELIRKKRIEFESSVEYEDFSSGEYENENIFEMEGLEEIDDDEDIEEPEDNGDLYSFKALGVDSNKRYHRLF